MPICRFTNWRDQTPRIGVVSPESGQVEQFEIDAESVDEAVRNGELNEMPAIADTYSRQDINLLSPISRPSNLIGIGLNYAGHAAEGGFDKPEEPLFFAKSPSSLTAPSSEVVRHQGVANLHYEGEVAVVIGEHLRGASPDTVRDGIFGVAASNDVTARDMQAADIDQSHPWYRSKSMDTFTPVGPWITPAEDIDLNDISIETRLNGEIVQSSSTSDLIFSIPEAISYISEFISLQAGDVILTGTPAGIGEMVPGDKISVEVADVGILQNTVVEHY